MTRNHKCIHCEKTPTVGIIKVDGYEIEITGCRQHIQEAQRIYAEGLEFMKLKNRRLKEPTSQFRAGFMAGLRVTIDEAVETMQKYLVSPDALMEKALKPEKEPPA